MPKFSFRLKNGQKDVYAGWLKATFVTDIAKCFSTLTGDTSRISCAGVNIGQHNEIVISTTSVVEEPHLVVEAIKNWIKENTILLDYDFKITVTCYSPENRKITATA